MNTFRLTWDELCADWWSFVATLAGVYGPVWLLEFALRRYDAADERVGRDLFS
jgi:hypothetical protein